MFDQIERQYRDSSSNSSAPHARHVSIEPERDDDAESRITLSAITERGTELSDKASEMEEGESGDNGRADM